YKACKWSSVMSTTLALMEMATPIIPISELEARKNNVMNLKTEPIKLLYIACFARSSAINADCKGACIYSSKKNGAISIIYLLALLVSYMYVKIGMENNEKIMDASAPDAKEMRIA